MDGVSKSDTPDGVDPPAEDEKSLADGSWILASRVVAQAASFLIFLIAVQFLSKGEFGLFAVATSTAIFMLQIARAGWGQYILAGRVERQYIGFIYSVAIIWGILFTIFGILAGLTTAALMADPTLGNVIALISLTIAPACYCHVNESTLFRRGRVRVVAFIWIFAELIGLIVGVITLFLGWKEYGLVAARLSVSVISVFCNLIVNNATPTLKAVPGLLKDAVKFYRDLLGAVVLSFAGANSGLYIIGFVFGEAAAGVYRAAGRFASAIMEFIWEPSGILAWKNIPPTDEELANGFDKKQIVGDRYISFMRMFALIACPIMLGVASVSPELINLLLGPDWADAAPLFSLLVIGSMFMLPSMISRAVFSALEQSKTIAKLQVVHLISFLAFLLGIGWLSPVVAAAVHIPPSALLLALTIYNVAKLLERPSSQIVASLYKPFFTAIVMAGIVTLVRHSLLEAGLNGIAILSASIVTGIVAYIFLIAVFSRSLMEEAIQGIVKNMKNSSAIASEA